MKFLLAKNYNLFNATFQKLGGYDSENCLIECDFEKVILKEYPNEKNKIDFA